MLRFALVVAVVSSALTSSCNDEPSVAEEYFAIVDRIQAARCECTTCDYPEDWDSYSGCLRGLFAAYQSEARSWFDCALEAAKLEDACVQRVGCDVEALDRCRVWVVDVCGDVPFADRYDREADLQCTRQLTCEDGSRVEGRSCNQTAECADGSDEVGCGDDEDAGSDADACDAGADCQQGTVPEPAPDAAVDEPVTPTAYCANGTPLPLTAVCDGRLDCGQGEDEAYCFECGLGSAGERARLGAVCDGVQDCTYNADEKVPACTTLLVNAAFRCADGEEIDAERVCDAHADCAQGEDEASCFACGADTQPSLRISQRCDGIRDCSNGSDEANCARLPTQPQTCEAYTTEKAGAWADATCAECLCDHGGFYLPRCGDDCWDFLKCRAAHCAPDGTGCELSTCEAPEPERYEWLSIIDDAMWCAEQCPVLRISP